MDHALSLGWYRSNQKIFTCSHVELGAVYRVHWLRYAVAGLEERPSHKRLRKRNKDFNFIIEDFNTVHPDQADLYKKYRAFITFDGATSIEDSLFGDEFTGNNIFNTKCISVFDSDKLIAGGYFDLGEKAAASILHFFDPHYARFSLGKYLILITLDFLRQHGYEHYYPGYVVQGLPKMNYKLFLGKEHAEYFIPETSIWHIFTEDILVGQPADIESLYKQLASGGEQ